MTFEPLLRGMILLAIAQSLWFMVPAYVANPGAVLFGGGLPLDFGRSFFDGKRIFGDGKTWKGLMGGIFTGIFIGTIQWISTQGLNATSFSFGHFPQFLPLLLILAFGSLLGDLLGSFIKRRMGKKKGEKVLGLDQYNFLIGALLLLLVFERDWFLDFYIRGEAFFGLLSVILITPILHRGVNIIGYKIGKKEVPW